MGSYTPPYMVSSLNQGPFHEGAVLYWGPKKGALM